MKNKKRTNEDFIKEISSLVGDEYVFNEEYIKMSAKLSCTHKICGLVYSVAPNNFISKGNRCPKCSKVQKTNTDFVNEVFNIVGDEYKFLEDYVNNKTKIKCIHNISGCMNEWKIEPKKFIEGIRCPKCALVYKTNDEFKEEIENLVGDEYKFLEDYVNNKTKIKCIHNTECGHIFHPTPDSFINRGSRCPICASTRFSKSCQSIKKILENLNISFEIEKKFEGCINIHQLPFDFYFKIGNEEFCIEYDGIQHFKAIEAWGGEESLSATQNRDSIKNSFCIKNNINLLRIIYTDPPDIFKELIYNFINKRSTTIPQGSTPK